MNVEKEINISAFRENSVRDCVGDVELCFGTIRNVLIKHKYVPYKCRLTQYILSADKQRLLEICRWFVNDSKANPNLLRLILTTDEYYFTNQECIIGKIIII